MRAVDLLAQRGAVHPTASLIRSVLPFRVSSVSDSSLAHSRGKLARKRRASGSMPAPCASVRMACNLKNEPGREPFLLRSQKRSHSDRPKRCSRYGGNNGSLPPLGTDRGPGFARRSAEDREIGGEKESVHGLGVRGNSNDCRCPQAHTRDLHKPGDPLGRITLLGAGVTAQRAPRTRGAGRARSVPLPQPSQNRAVGLRGFLRPDQTVCCPSDRPRARGAADRA